MLSIEETGCYRPFAVSILAVDQGVVVVPEGELDMESADVLERKVTELRAVGTSRLTIDLKDLDFMDSCGLRSLLALREDWKRTGQELELAEGPPAVQRLFSITGTRSLFDWR